MQPDCIFWVNRSVKPLPKAVFGASLRGHGAPGVPRIGARVGRGTFFVAHATGTLDESYG